jgi:chemosensory pili system protein ChpA (sensor histidine kinase/response regulator)
VLNADLVRLQPILREMREQLGTAKNIWLRVTLGRADSLPKLRETLQSVHANAVEVGNAALIELTASLVTGLGSMPPSDEVPDALAMEYATGILLAESAVSNFGSLASNFPQQVTAMLARLEAAREARPIPAGTGALIDGIFRRAQERILLAHVAREIQTNLRHIEQVLDAFFRDPTKRSEIAALGKDSNQIRGALRMLEQDDAERLLQLCQTADRELCQPADPD